MSRESRATNLRVGAFLTGGVITFIVAVFTVGQKSGMFEGKDTLYVHFGDINGLVEGAPVRLAGLDVGTVSTIQFPEQLEQRKARIALSIKSRFMNRIRTDSIAFIDSKGLLGDKLVNISLGSPDQPPLPDGGTLKTKAAPSMENLASSLEGAIQGFTQVTQTADDALKRLTGEQVGKDVGRITASVANIIERVEHGPGLAHDLAYGERHGAELLGVLVEARAAIGDLRGAVARADRAIAAIEQGDGLAHELLYGQKGKEIVARLHESATGVADAVRQAREGDGLLHALLYDPNNAKAVTELTQASERINRIVSEIEKGRGTLGGLVMDPSVYEDLKSVLGNVERNVLLKALIRFAIKEGDIERPAKQVVRREPAQP